MILSDLLSVTEALYSGQSPCYLSQCRSICSSCGTVFPLQGVVPIILSWFFSPILTGAAAATIFGIVRTVVLRRQNAYSLAFWVLPPAVFVTLFINIFFVCECP